jgi:rRNA small subunit pseudouridine methyltransferase Nep1
MMNLEDSFKRGRPDLVHVSLMEAVDSPLYKRRGVKVYVHTRNDEILTLADNVRLPKHYTRFEGVIRKLLFNRKADRDGLIDYSRGSVGDLLERLEAVDAVGLTKMGEPSNYGEIAARLLGSNRPCLIVGGFAKGHFSAQTKAALARVYSAAPESLEAHVVISRMIYELEKLKMAED